MKRLMGRLATAAAVAVLTLMANSTQALADESRTMGKIRDCDEGFLCLYVDSDYRSGKKQFPVKELYDCRNLSVPDGRWSSVINNTRFSFQLWNLDGTNSDSRPLVGTAAGFRGYGSFGADGDNTIDHIDSPNCGTEPASHSFDCPTDICLYSKADGTGVSKWIDIRWQGGFGLEPSDWNDRTQAARNNSRFVVYLYSRSADGACMHRKEQLAPGESKTLDFFDRNTVDLVAWDEPWSPECDDV